jgi:hypothetical protein
MEDQLPYLRERLELMVKGGQTKRERTIRMFFVLTGQIPYLGKRLELI